MNRLTYTLAACACSLAFVSAAAFAGNSNQNQSNWGYNGNNGPNNWSKLDSSFALCGEGKNQSPINITQTSNAQLPPLNISYAPVEPTIVNNGHTIQVDVPAGNTFSDGKKSYSLAQLHFHTPSENKINGKSYPLELHLVHKSQDGKLAVIGVMVEEGNTNPELAKLFQNIPANQGQKQKLTGTPVNVKKLLPSDQRYYQFVGSLTTPPCSEGVNWLVMQQPITASKEQIKEFQAVYPNNARPVQPTNNRPVVRDL